MLLFWELVSERERDKQTDRDPWQVLGMLRISPLASRASRDSWSAQHIQVDLSPETQALTYGPSIMKWRHTACATVAEPQVFFFFLSVFRSLIMIYHGVDVFSLIFSEVHSLFFLYLYVVYYTKIGKFSFILLNTFTILFFFIIFLIIVLVL